MAKKERNNTKCTQCTQRTTNFQIETPNPRLYTAEVRGSSPLAPTRQKS